jgi:hypothetical protein
MKFFLFILCFTIFGWLGVYRKASPVIPGTRIEVNDTIDFTKIIHPILSKNCSPCHFTGGKMYDRLPFDKDTTIINHAEGILKRIKGEENDLLKAFIRQHKDDNR